VPDAVANWVANWARSEILKRAAGAPVSKFRNLNTSFISCFQSSEHPLSAARWHWWVMSSKGMEAFITDRYKRDQKPNFHFVSL
jgi:hypothetical protein